jgi:glycosyltransferase involved in cell wall biosynthesis
MPAKTQKVLMLTPSYDPIIGGTETVVKNLAINLNKIGVKTDVITFNMDKKWVPRWKWEIKVEDGFKVYRIPAFNPFTRIPRIPNPMGHFFKLNVIPNPSFRKIIQDYDILHFHDDVDLTFPLFSYFVKKPKLFSCHTLDATFNKYKKSFLRYVFQNVADVYISGCKSTAALLTKLGIPDNKIGVLYYGVDADRYIPDTKSKEENLVLCASRIEPRKGIDVLLKSLQYIQTPIHLAILGVENKSNYFKEIKKMVDIENKRGKHKITFLLTVSGDKLIPWYQRASIFVTPHTHNPVFPVINPEALACGTPIVGTNVGGIPEIVIDEVTGLLVPPDDPVELASAIQRLLEDKDLRDRCGKEGRALVEQSFSWSVIAKGLCEIYEEMILSK